MDGMNGFSNPCDMVCGDIGPLGPGPGAPGPGKYDGVSGGTREPMKLLPALSVSLDE